MTRPAEAVTEPAEAMNAPMAFGAHAVARPRR
jgi:hypothetical protein